MSEMTETKAEAKPPITYDDFAKLDLRVGLVTEANPHPKADRLLVLKVNVGGVEERQIVAGIRLHYKPEELVGKNILVLCNLEPKELRGVVSHGMLLAGSNDASGFALISTDRPLAAGSLVK